MSEVYGHTFLNIAAAAATGPHGSLFYGRKEQIPEDVMDMTTTWSGDLVAGHYVFMDLSFASLLSKNYHCISEPGPSKRDFTSHVGFRCGSYVLGMQVYNGNVRSSRRV